MRTFPTFSCQTAPIGLPRIPKCHQSRCFGLRENRKCHRHLSTSTQCSKCWCRRMEIGLRSFKKSNLQTENGLPRSRKCLRRGTMTTLGDKSTERSSLMTTPEKLSAHRRASMTSREVRRTNRRASISPRKVRKCLRRSSISTLWTLCWCRREKMMIISRTSRYSQGIRVEIKTK